MRNKNIGIIGCGNMGQAIMEGLISSGLIPRNQILVTDIERSKVTAVKAKFKVNIEPANIYLVRKADVVILAVKPQTIDLVLKEIRNEVSKNKLFISIAAGITTRYIETKLTKQAKVTRVMPNTPALVKEAMSLICRGSKATNNDLKLTQDIFGALGKTGLVKESLLDVVTAISGSGPAYYFYLSEILIELGKERGISEELAQKVVKQTFLGSAKLFNLSQDDIQTLRRKITSKGGVTEAAFQVLENKKVKAIFKQAIFTAIKRSQELSKK